MNRTYEDMSKHELTRLVVRLTKQHDEWSAEAKRLREELAEVEYRLEMAEDVLGRSDWNTIYREIIDEVIE